MMENNQKPKLGGGIMTISIIELIFRSLAIFGFVILMLTKDTVQAQLQTAGIDASTLTTSQLIISLALSILVVVGIILILCRKSLGVYTYFTCIVISIIYSIVMSGFSLSVLLNLIIPGLMAVFIMQKQEVFGFGAKSDSIDPPSNMQ